MSIKYKNTLENKTILLYSNFVALDFETTGLNPKKDKIIEVGAVRVINGVLKDEFTALVNPKQSISEAAAAVTGITDEAVKDQRTISEVITELKEFIGCSPIVAHNAPFDIAFYERALRHCVLNTVIDTLGISRKQLPHLHSHKLSALAEYYGIEKNDEHRALDDAKTAAKVYLCLSGIGGVEHGKLRKKRKRKKRNRKTFEIRQQEEA